MDQYFWVSGRSNDGTVYADSVKAADERDAAMEFIARHEGVDFEKLEAKPETYR